MAERQLKAKVDTDANRDLIKSTSNRFGVPKIDQVQGEILYDNLQALQKSNPMLIKLLLEQSLAAKYVFGSSEYKAV